MEDKQREIKSDLGNRTINDVMNEFLLSMVNKDNGALIAELRIRWREFLGSVITIDMEALKKFETDKFKKQNPQ